MMCQIVVSNPGKSSPEVQFYRPISLLPIMSKVFEKIWFGATSTIRRREQANARSAIWLHEEIWYSKTSSIRQYTEEIAMRILGPLFFLFTTGLPTNSVATFSTFADDMAIIAIRRDPTVALQYLQRPVNAILFFC